MDPSQSELESIRRILADLAARIDRIERKLGREQELLAAAPPSRPQSQPAVPVRPRAESAALLPPDPLAPPPPPAVGTPPSRPDLESRIGSHWLNRIGIGAAGRVAIGLIAGIAIVLWSERFRLKGYQAFSYSLKAVGIGSLYLSLWAASHLYSLIPNGVAFVMMLMVTASAAAMSLDRKSTRLNS